MRFTHQENISCDVLVIGSGGAGLRAAIAAAETGSDVLILSKARTGHATNTYLSKAIIAASGWGDKQDNSRIHADDTLAGGYGLNEPALVARFTGRIHRETALLKSWGMAYATDETGSPAVIQIPGHTHARHVTGRNFKGSDLVLPLKKKARAAGVRFLGKTLASSLLVAEERVCGATGVTENGAFIRVGAKAVIIATGGFGQVFENTNNAPGITGDGLALALRTGVPLQDMEFVQFYPTAYGRRGSRLLLYERLLVQDGVFLKNSRGQDIVTANGYAAASITRDELSRVMMKEIMSDPENRGSIDMDLTGLSPDAAAQVAMLLPKGGSRGAPVIAVAPTTHFCMGGMVADPDAGTVLPGLFAAGEATAGAHGANRLGGNSLAEVIAMGGIAGQAAAEEARALTAAPDAGALADREMDRLESLAGQAGPLPKELIRELKQTMWRDAGILRDRKSLEKALEAVLAWKTVQAAVTRPADLIRFLEFGNMCLVSEAVIRSALERTESRGAHFRRDFPDADDGTWLKNIRVRMTDGGMGIDHVPVPSGLTA